MHYWFHNTPLISRLLHKLGFLGFGGTSGEKLGLGLCRVEVRVRVFFILVLRVINYVSKRPCKFGDRWVHVCVSSYLVKDGLSHKQCVTHKRSMRLRMTVPHRLVSSCPRRFRSNGSLLGQLVGDLLDEVLDAWSRRRVAYFQAVEVSCCVLTEVSVAV